MALFKSKKSKHDLMMAEIDSVIKKYTDVELVDMVVILQDNNLNIIAHGRVKGSYNKQEDTITANETLVPDIINAGTLAYRTVQVLDKTGKLMLSTTNMVEDLNLWSRWISTEEQYAEHDLWVSIGKV